MNDVDMQTMNEEGLTFKRVICDTKYGKVFLVQWNKYRELYSLERVDVRHFEERQTDVIKNFYHTNIINIYRYWYREKYVYILMDYCPVDLYRLVTVQGVISEQKFIQYSFEMLQSLKILHDKKFCHGNIRPSKFLIDRYNHIRICDFSNAVSASEVSESEFQKMKLDDIWSLGETFYYMLTGLLISDLYMTKKDAKSRNFANVKYPSSIPTEIAMMVSCCLQCKESNSLTIDDILRCSIYRRRRASSSSIPTQSMERFSSNSLRSLNVIVKPVLTRVISFK
ncbi:CAMK family protein kinase [Trichomonas vaginalis G3]|uniref:CAMK family protein kinase n=1 Tax=Trichomonas vaginalis (strain ATCC PRA-98 / G3) TaxID=412133 RepID=A2GIV4_TRIV3|nr:histone serine kinase protein [Trichomonas vaginalis G3]EAX82913.1 CAMK family protein kinase [Trichomonas vaginalis G3]KAI5500252.1 histone serine kinase protein [Trichomonas vaginalis G3]|eukprot:XP_001295843.1 CAMK family protein kinase [Trichomonas vaginalis G3]